jgi:hypothetical protein
LTSPCHSRSTLLPSLFFRWHVCSPLWLETHDLTTDVHSQKLPPRTCATWDVRTVHTSSFVLVASSFATVSAIAAERELFDDASAITRAATRKRSTESRTTPPPAYAAHAAPFDTPPATNIQQSPPPSYFESRWKIVVTPEP